MPITASGLLKSLNFSSASRGRMAQKVGLARWFRNGAYGSLSVMRTVWRSTTSIDCTGSNRSRKPDFAMKRSSEYLTSSAISSRPLTGGLLWKRTPFFRLNV